MVHEGVLFWFRVLGVGTLIITSILSYYLFFAAPSEAVFERFTFLLLTLTHVTFDATVRSEFFFGFIVFQFFLFFFFYYIPALFWSRLYFVEAFFSMNFDRMKVRGRTVIFLLDGAITVLIYRLSESSAWFQV